MHEVGDAIRTEFAMNERLFWIVMAQWIVCGIVVTVLLGWVSMQRDRRPDASESRILRMPPVYAIAGTIGVVVFLGALAWSHAYAAEWRHALTDAVFLLFAGLSCWVLSDFALVRLRVDPSGVSTRTLSGRWRTLAWSQVREVRYSTMMLYFRLRAADGATAKVPVTALGLPAFARLALRFVPDEALDALTREQLEETAAGRPPPLL